MPEASAAAERRLSPQKLEPQLQLPRVVRGRDGPDPAGAAVAVWRAEVRVIEQVERFEAELEARLSAQREALRECGVELPELRSLDGVAPGVAERLARIGRHADAGAIEPVVDGLRVPLRIGIAADVGPVVIGAAEVLRDSGDDERRAWRVGERHRLAGVEAVDARDLPAADDGVHDARRSCTPFLAVAERQRPHEARGAVVRLVVLREAEIRLEVMEI